MKRETAALLEKAARAIFGGKILLRRGDTDFATGLAHLSMCCTARELLNERVCTQTAAAPFGGLLGSTL